MMKIKCLYPIRLLLAAGGCIAAVCSFSEASPDMRVVDCGQLAGQIQQLQANVVTLQDLVNNTYPTLLANIQSQITAAQDTLAAISNGNLAFIQVVGGNPQAVATAISMLPPELQGLAQTYDQARRDGSPLLLQAQQAYFDASNRLRNSFTDHVAVMTGQQTQARMDAATAATSLDAQNRQLNSSNALYQTFCGPNPTLPNVTPN